MPPKFPISYLAMPFDPCREWLGIASTDLKDPHRVLAISTTETDGDTIARLAEERLARLAKIIPGPFAKAHAALMTRIAEARDTLLATATWDSELDESDKNPGGSPPPAPTFSPPPPPAMAAAARPLTSAPPLPPVPTLPGGAPGAVVDPPFYGQGAVAEPDFLQPETIPFVPVAAGPRAAAVRRSSGSSGGAGLGIFAIVLAIAVGVGYYAYKALDVEGRGWQVALNSPVVRPAAPQPPDPMPPAPPPEAPPPMAEEPSRPPSKRPRDSTSPPAESRAPEEGTEGMSPAMPPPGTPTIDPEAERRVAAERARIAELVSTSMDDAYRALQRGEFDAADRTLASVAKQVGDDVEAATRIERWRFLATYARAYSDYRDKAFQAANSGREYEIDDRRLVVVEVTPTKFIYRVSGRNVEMPRDRLSPRIEMTVVETWFAADGRASNHLFLGTRWLCFDPPDTRRARAAWQKAGDGGENVSPLMALLDDPVIRQTDGR